MSDLDRYDDFLERSADSLSAAITSALDDLENDTMEVERVFTTVTDCLADLWVLHRKDPKKRNQLIIQQLESALLDDAELTVEHRRV